MSEEKRCGWCETLCFVILVSLCIVGAYYIASFLAPLVEPLVEPFIPSLPWLKPICVGDVYVGSQLTLTVWADKHYAASVHVSIYSRSGELGYEFSFPVNLTRGYNEIPLGEVLSLDTPTLAEVTITSGKKTIKQRVLVLKEGENELTRLRADFARALALVLPLYLVAVVIALTTFNQRVIATLIPPLLVIALLLLVVADFELFLLEVKLAF